MKKVLETMAVAVLAFSAVSCTISDIIGINLDYDLNDPWSSWEKVPAGVYVGTDDSYNKGDIIAKGTDGSMIAGKVPGQGQKIPGDFCAYDGKNTTYEFGMGEYKGQDYLNKTVRIVSDAQSTGSFVTGMNNVASTRKLWASKGVGIITTPKKYKKIAAGGDMTANYKAICSKYQAGGYVSLDEQLTVEYTKYDTEWLYDKYPADMNSRGWVVPYTGPGKLEFVSVFRQKGWDEVGNRLILWGGCQFSNITWVKAQVSGISYEEAKAYVDNVKASGKYNVVTEDVADGSKMISFIAHSNDEIEHPDQSGYGGYIHPSYKITFASVMGTVLSIEFGVTYVTYV